jgi:hypothetical protein
MAPYINTTEVRRNGQEVRRQHDCRRLQFWMHLRRYTASPGTGLVPIGDAIGLASHQPQTWRSKHARLRDILRVCIWPRGSGSKAC